MLRPVRVNAPNIIAMYSELVYTYIAPVLDREGRGGGCLGPWPAPANPPTPRGGQPLGSGRQLPPQLTDGRRPLWGGGGGGGGGHWRGGSGRGNWAGGSRRGLGGLGWGSGRVGWGGGGAPGGSVGGGGPGGAIWGVGGGRGAQAPLTSPCPPSNHTITINLTLTFAASWFGFVGVQIGQNFP